MGKGLEEFVVPGWYCFCLFFCNRDVCVVVLFTVRSSLELISCCL